MKSNMSKITQLVSDGAGIWTLNLSYLKNKSTTKEKYLKLIFKTPYNQCEPPPSAPSPAAFWVSSTPGRLIHGIPWHDLSCPFFTPLPRLFAPWACHLLCPALQNTTIRTELSGRMLTVHHSLTIWTPFFLVFYCCYGRIRISQTTQPHTQYSCCGVGLTSLHVSIWGQGELGLKWVLTSQMGFGKR